MRTHWCGELRSEHEGLEVRVAGWVHRRRDHGGVIFLDLRDREGLVQVTMHPDEQPEAHAAAEKVRSEYVLVVQGTVRKRPEGSENPELGTGQVEVAATRIDIVSEAETPPFLIEDRADVSEEIRLRYRYLDLRRPEMLKMLRLRHAVNRAIRSFFDEEGFIEVETPVLTKATPEGARDYLVPWRGESGAFYALPQSPQLFKQLLMVAGIDRYYQIARCFRDEDPRADRQPDFTQLDMEMSFVTEEDIYEVTERMFSRIFREAIGTELTIPFPRLTYEESMRRYGTDKPDLRFGLELVDVTDLFRNTQIRVFRSTIDTGGVAVALRVEGGSTMARKELDRLTDIAKNLGVGGLAWMAFEAGEVKSPLSKFATDEEVEALKRSTDAGDGDLILIVSDKVRPARAALGAVRSELGRTLGLIPQVDPEDPDAWKFVWVNDAPLVEWNEDEKRWDPVHHPFTAPRPEDEGLISSDPGGVRAQCYDIVLNGNELASGSIRIHRPDLQRRVFELIGIDEETAEKRFGWFLRAYDFGAPPHGGIAPGIDRIVALLGQKESIRDGIAFPKTGTYTDPLTGAPDAVSAAQLKELHLRVLDS